MSHIKLTFFSIFLGEDDDAAVSVCFVLFLINIYNQILIFSLNQTSNFKSNYQSVLDMLQLRRVLQSLRRRNLKGFKFSFQFRKQEQVHIQCKIEFSTFFRDEMYKIEFYNIIQCITSCYFGRETGKNEKSSKSFISGFALIVPCKIINKIRSNNPFQSKFSLIFHQFPGFYRAKPRLGL